MYDKRIMGLLGIAEKAGRTASGEFQTEQALKTGTACLTILAGDASPNTRKKFTDLCEKAGCQILFLSNKQDLAHAIGKDERSCMAILDQGLADAIRQTAERLADKQGE